MNMCTVDYEIHNVPLSVPLWRRKVERFLEANQLRPDELDYYAIVTEPDGDEILAGGGLKEDIIKCVAVSPQLRDAHLSNLLVSHLISEAAQRGYQSVKVFTKPQNRAVFESFGFHLLGEAPLAILMENGHGLKNYCRYLRSCVEAQPQCLSKQSIPDVSALPTVGVIVMNANPFTLGHRFLIEQAARQVERLFVIPVKEERSLFAYDERKAMIEAGCSDLANVVVLEGSCYIISSATFPTYFLKQLSDAADTHMLLDIDIFRRHIAPALGASVRFVGSEPSDALTGRYNKLLQEHLPCVQVVERKQLDGKVISASAVRQALSERRFADAAALVPKPTLPYLLAHLACDALRQELDTTPKPGLVDRHDNGAHADMDYRLMLRSIEALRPYFVKLAQAGQQEKADHVTISAIGIEAERTMLAATGGVNTHRGALFALGLALVARTRVTKYQSNKVTRCQSNKITRYQSNEVTKYQSNKVTKCQGGLQATIAQIAQAFPDTQGTHGSKAVSQHQAKGALAMAREGYAQLFSDWLPFLHDLKQQGDPHACHKTLLRIMSQLDDTNILHRCGFEVAQHVKAEALETLNDFSITRLEAMNCRFTAENISPGGAADMLALTLFIYNISTF